MEEGTLSGMFQQFCVNEAPRIRHPIRYDPENVSVFYDAADVAEAEVNKVANADQQWNAFQTAVFPRYQSGGSLWKLAGSFRSLWNASLNTPLRVVFAIEWSASLFTILFHLLMFWTLHRLNQQGRGFSALHNSLMINDMFSAVGLASFDLNVLVLKHTMGRTNIVCTPWAWPVWHRFVFHSVGVLYFLFAFAEIHLLLALTLDRIQAIIQPLEYRVHDSFRRGILVNGFIYSVNGGLQLWYRMAVGPVGLPSTTTAPLRHEGQTNENSTQQPSHLNNNSQAESVVERYPLPNDWKELVCLKRYQLLDRWYQAGPPDHIASSRDTLLINYYWSHSDRVCTYNVRGDVLQVIGTTLVMIPGVLLILSVIVLLILLQRPGLLKSSSDKDKDIRVKTISIKPPTTLRRDQGKGSAVYAYNNKTDAQINQPGASCNESTERKEAASTNSKDKAASSNNGKTTTQQKQQQAGPPKNITGGTSGNGGFGKAQTIVLLYENVSLVAAYMTFYLPINRSAVIYVSMLSLSFRYLSAPFCLIAISRKFRAVMLQFPLLAWLLQKVCPQTEHPLLAVSAFLLVLFFFILVVLIPLFLLF